MRSDGEAWTLFKDQRSFQAKTGITEQLLDKILALKSTGLFTHTGQLPVQYGIALSSKQGAPEQLIEVLKVPDSIAATTSLIRLNKLPDVFRIQRIDFSELPLELSDYQDFRILDLSPYQQLDSLIWIVDSTRQTLLSRPSDAAALDSLLLAWQTLNGNAFANEFDEIAGQAALLGQLVIYPASQVKPLPTLKIYQDQPWPEPSYVLSSSLQKHKFFAASTPPFPLPNSPSFPPDNYRTVIAYGLNGRPLVQGAMHLLSNKTGQQHRLTPADTDSLLTLITSPQSYGLGTAACHDPRIGLIFYDRSNQPCGHMSICLACNNVLAEPSLGLRPATGYRNGFSLASRKKLRTLFARWGMADLQFSPLFDDEATLRASLTAQGLDQEAIEAEIAIFRTSQ